MDQIAVAGLEWVRGTEEPMLGSASFATTRWEEVALNDEARFVADLTEMGLEPSQVDDGLAVREQADLDISRAISDFWANHPYRYIDTPPAVQAQVAQVYDSARRGAWESLRDWWSGRVTEVQSRASTELRLPLFVLSAPDGEGCKVEFSSEQGRESQAGWTLKVAGSGIGGQTTVNVTVSSAFEADSGQRKLIFMPVTVDVEEVLIHKPGSAPVTRFRIDVARLNAQQPLPGALLLDPDVDLPLGPHSGTYPLAGDSSGSLATYSYTYQATGVSSVDVGLKVHGVDLGVSSEGRLDSTVSLTCKLRSGRDYHQYHAATGDGVLWR